LTPLSPREIFTGSDVRIDPEVKNPDRHPVYYKSSLIEVVAGTAKSDYGVKLTER